MENECSFYDFKQEIKEFTESKFIKKAEFLTIVEMEKCVVLITTLEDLEFKINWSVISGLVIEEIKDQSGNVLQIDKGSSFDDFYQLLNKYSDMYKQEFAGNLFQKLSEIQRADDDN